VLLRNEDLSHSVSLCGAREMTQQARVAGTAAVLRLVGLLMIRLGVQTGWWHVAAVPSAGLFGLVVQRYRWAAPVSRAAALARVRPVGVGLMRMFHGKH
jgi:hypothetical protein